VMQMATAIVKTVSRYPNLTSFAKKFFLYCFSILFSFFTAKHDQTQQRQKRIKLLYLLSELAIASHSKKWQKVPFTIKSQLLYQLSYRGNRFFVRPLTADDAARRPCAGIGSRGRIRTALNCIRGIIRAF
jgi:hypothetical protein